MVEAEDLEERIREGVNEVSHVVVKDLTGTKDHWEALIVSEAFCGQVRHRTAPDGLCGPGRADGRAGSCTCAQDVLARELG